jgi:hypothetical protein
MQFLGFRVTPEAAVAGGEIDGTIDTATGRSYVIEMKYAKAATGAPSEAISQALTAATTKAVAQIDARGYADRYAGTGRKVYKVGVAVAGRGVVRVAVSQT